jgi:hypothetical protein
MGCNSAIKEAQPTSGASVARKCKASATKPLTIFNQLVFPHGLLDFCCPK